MAQQGGMGKPGSPGLLSPKAEPSLHSQEAPAKKMFSDAQLSQKDVKMEDDSAAGSGGGGGGKSMLEPSGGGGGGGGGGGDSKADVKCDKEINDEPNDSAGAMSPTTGKSGKAMMAGKAETTMVVKSEPSDAAASSTAATTPASNSTGGATTPHSNSGMAGQKGPRNKKSECILYSLRIFVNRRDDIRLCFAN